MGPASRLQPVASRDVRSEHELDERDVARGVDAVEVLRVSEVVQLRREKASAGRRSSEPVDR